MTPADRALSTSVEAFRRDTARDADGGATRARVLLAAGARLRRRALLRRTLLGMGVVALVVVATLSASAAWTTLRRSRDVAPTVSTAAPTRPRPVLRVVSTEPVAAVDVASPAAPRAGDDGETRAYGRAHAAHFAEGEPRAALALWDSYLARYPRGAFVPEARFNRALCLLRVGRRQEALAALRPFAAGAFGGYRQREAETLIDWSGGEAR